MRFRFARKSSGKDHNGSKRARSPLPSVGNYMPACVLDRTSNVGVLTGWRVWSLAN